MMICPETYYEEYLKGKNAEQIMTAIRSLKREISRLKTIMEKPDYQCMMHPSEDVRIWCNRLYLDRARQALVDVGGTYVPSKAEVKADEFNANLPYVCKVEFSIGGFFSGFETKTYTIEGDAVKTDVSSMKFPPELSEVDEDEALDKETLLDGLAELYIGEWRRRYDPSRWGYMVCDGTQWHLYIYFSNGKRPVKIEGSNDYPYNFNDLLELFDIDTSWTQDDETEE